MRHINIPIFVTHLGCPNCCSFCNQKRIAASQPMDIKRARTQIDRALKTIPKRDVFVEIAFFGGSFSGIDLCEQTGYLKLANEYIKSGKAHAIRLSTRPDMIDDEILSNFKKYGVKSVELGVQSMDDEVLKQNRRGHTAAHVKYAAQKIKEYGFDLGIQLMPGLYGDRYEKSIFSANEAAALSPKTARIYPTLVIRDTELEDLYIAGKFTPLTLADAVDTCADIYEIMKERGVKILRMGLMASEGLIGGDLVAGPYHSAFGELVMGKIMLKKAESEIKSRGLFGKNILIFVSPGSVSKMVGQNRRNIIALEEKNAPGSIKVKEDADLFNGEIRVSPI